MDRREHLRTLVLAGLAGTAILPGCTSGTSSESKAGADLQAHTEGYGRTPKEQKHDARLQAETFFTPAEVASLTVLCDIILPADERSGSASEAGVPDFIEFMAKDIPELQLPLRGGLAWLDHASRQMGGSVFAEAAENDRLQLLDRIAYPPDDAEETELTVGQKFFNLMRFLTLTGFYTSQPGVQEDLQYVGNYANVWDGVPAEVLAEHDVDYEPDWVAKCLDPATRNEQAQWDESGNLL